MILWKFEYQCSYILYVHTYKCNEFCELMHFTLLLNIIPCFEIGFCGLMSVYLIRQLFKCSALLSLNVRYRFVRYSLQGCKNAR